MDGPFIWNINENIPINLFVAHPNTNLGLTGQTSYITLSIQRLSDNKYWNGTIWTASPTNLTIIEADSINQPGRYVYVLSAIANNTADKYIAHVKISNPPLIEGEAYETHVSRNLELRVYESEPG